MGADIDREEFGAEEYAAFTDQLRAELEQLRELLERPGFGEGETSIGAEVELHLADAAGEPACVNKAVLAAVDHPRCTLETDAFNFELNSAPQPLAGQPFTRLNHDLSSLLSSVRGAAAAEGARLVLAGTLPTLTVAHLQAGVLSDAPRYRAMSRILRERRGEAFAVRIEGREALHAECDDVALEGATASLQVHLRASPAAFPNLYNAAQLAAAPLLAATGNSPYFDGKRLWEETRIALFKHAVDTRLDENERLHTPARVSLGHGYIHHAVDPFAENVALHEPIFPVLGSARAAELPALRLHQGTVWNWNRAVYDPAGGGHLRLEHRVIGSGPTLIDMLANTALALGLSLALAKRMPAWLPSFPFAYAQRNLYRAAKYGLSAELAWPNEVAPSPRPRSARELVLELLPLAAAALVEHGVDAHEAHDLLGVVRARVESGRTGAFVQEALLARHERGLPRMAALKRMLEDYIELSLSNRPVHTWQS